MCTKSWGRPAMSLQMYSCDFGFINTVQHDKVNQQRRHAKYIIFPYVSLNNKPIVAKMCLKYKLLLIKHIFYLKSQSKSKDIPIPGRGGP
jgi:hypothetical protein